MLANGGCKTDRDQTGGVLTWIASPARAFSMAASKPFRDRAIVNELVFGNMGDHDSDLTVRKVLLELDAAVNRYENVKLLLCRDKEGAILQGVPALLMNGGNFVITEELFDAWIYALVNEDAHSRSWLLAKSSTARTCARVMD